MKHHKRYSKIILVCLLWVLSSISLTVFAITEQVRVSANNDDAEERVSNGDMSRGSNDLDLGYSRIVGMRFRSVDIPQGATINSAYIQFETDETDSGATNLVVYGVDEDSPNQFANNDDNISDRTKTTASVSWSPSAWNNVNGLHQTSDIKSIIQEIINRSGWSANNNLVIIVEPGSGCSTSACQRAAESHNGESGSAPLLVVDYSVGGGGGGLLSGSLNVDNTFNAYISTDDSVQGTLIGTGNNWPTTVDISSSLTVGQDYYLHIYATDVGGVAGFLGDFELTNTDHTFSNGLTTLNTNTTNWSVSTVGWNNYQPASGYGVNGVAPWGTRSGVDANAQWIWSSDNSGHNVNYFSTSIRALSLLEVQSVGGSCAALQEVTVTFNDEVEQITAETVSNYQLTNPQGGTIGINSATKSATDTVTLALSSTLNDLTEYTVSVDNVQNLSGDTISAGTTSLFSLSCNLNCITDTFAGPGGLSSSWSASSSNGSFGIPRIIDNGRLRLTDASGQVATVATLLNQFPGAGNKIEIEFDYFGYDGSGADGIAVTFSDASIPPVPGSYGGALGYAQRSGDNPGFAGGWLGIGIDEYGNFANPNEGKDGGSGFERDSVALRGSGSGTSGYKYLTSTGTLSPGIDASGGTPNPGHRYKISIDHTMGGAEAYVTVERDTGSGYVVIIPRFDIYSVNPSQAAVPANWVVSFTGSTGGSTNIHEIGDFEVCAALPISSYGSPDHYEIIHSSPGVTCEGSEITINAHDASHNLFTVTSNTAITVSTNPAVDSIISSPVTMLAGASSATFYLNESDVVQNIDIDVTDGTASDLDDAGTEDEVFNFLDTAFRFYADNVHNDIDTQIAGKPSNVAPGNQSLTLRAVRTNTDTGGCEAALQGQTAVELAYECNNPTTCTAANDLLTFTGVTSPKIDRNDNAAVNNYTDVDLTFDANGEAPFSFNYFDAGAITLHARKTIAANSPEPAFELTGSSNSFATRPFAFHLEVAGGPSATGGSGTKYRKAGENFDVTLRPVIYESGDDANTNSDLANNALTPNFGSHNGISLNLGHSLQAPTGIGASGGVLSGWSNQSVIFNNTGRKGEYQFGTLSWSEVGVISMSAEHSDYLGSGESIAGNRPNVGRFYPDHFDVLANNGSFANTCNLGANPFTYIGQGFTYGTAPSLTITAKNLSGGTTENYTDSNFMKLVLSDITRVFPNADVDQNGADNATLMRVGTSLNAGETLTATGAGMMTYLFDATDIYSYTKDDNSMIGEFDSDLAIAVNDFNDVDGASATSNPSVLPTAIELRYGRLALGNAHGPETENLKIPMSIQYLDRTSSTFILNTDNSCSSYNAINMVVNPSLANSGTSSASGSGTFNGGLSPLAQQIEMSAPGDTHQGAVNLCLNVDNWLKFDWNGDGLDLTQTCSASNPPSQGDNPMSTASFNQYRGHDRIIYWWEVDQ